MTKRIRKGNDIDVSWSVELSRPDGSLIDLTSMSLTVSLCVGSKEFVMDYANSGLTIRAQSIGFTFYGRRQTHTGSYILKLSDSQNESITYDSCNAFILVDHSWEADEPTQLQFQTEVAISRVIIAQGPKGEKGDPGEIGSILSIGSNGNWYINGVDTGIAAGGVQGNPGAFKSMVFKRSESKPDTPVGGTYARPIPHDPTTLVDWSDGIPSGTTMIWASSATFVYGASSAPTWSEPMEMKDTNKYDVEFALKQTDDNTPATPTDANRHGGSGTQIWYDPVLDKNLVDFREMYWMAFRELNGTTWSDWTITRIKGEKGDAGDGQSSFKSIIFCRMNVDADHPITKPGDSDGDFDYPSPHVAAGIDSDGNTAYWSDGIPAGTNTIWSCSRKFTNNGENQDAHWSDPRQMSDISGLYNVEFAKQQAPDDHKPEEPDSHNTHGGDGEQIWFDPNLDSEEDFTKMFWRAEQWMTNGVAGDWLITRIQGEKGESATSAFKSIVFKRTNSTPSTPTGGSYVNPVPSGWSDGIPSGAEQLWMCTRIFSQNGLAPQQSAWTTPMPATDTADIDFEYSSYSNPGNPTSNPSRWHNDGVEDDIWMAVRRCKNGVWGSWSILKIKGENGAPGEPGEPGIPGEPGRSITEVKEWFKIASAESGITPPEISVDPSTAGWSLTSPTVTEQNPFLWAFMRWKFSDNTYGQSGAYMIRSRYAGIDQGVYDEIKALVIEAIEEDLSEGSIIYRINQLESTAVTSTYVTGEINSARTEWRSYADGVGEASVLTSVTKGEMYWKKDSDDSMFKYTYFLQAGETADAAYETRVTNMGYTLTVIIAEMSAIRQKSDEIDLIVDDGTGHIAAGIQILKNASTTSGTSSGSKIILDTNTVQVTGQLNAEIVRAACLDATYVDPETGESIGQIITNHLVADDLTAGQVKTVSESGQMAALIRGGLLNIYLGAINENNLEENRRAAFGIENGNIVLKFYDANGKEMYNLGPGGIMQSGFSVTMPETEPIQFYRTASKLTVGSAFDGASYTGANRPTLYKYTDGMRMITVGSNAGGIEFYNPVTKTYSSSHSPYHGKYFANISNFSAPPTGYYYIINGLYWTDPTSSGIETALMIDASSSTVTTLGSYYEGNVKFNNVDHSGEGDVYQWNGYDER